MINGGLGGSATGGLVKMLGRWLPSEGFEGAEGVNRVDSML